MAAARCENEFPCPGPGIHQQRQYKIAMGLRFERTVNRARWFRNSLELQYNLSNMFLFWFMQK